MPRTFDTPHAAALLVFGSLAYLVVFRRAFGSLNVSLGS